MVTLRIDIQAVADDPEAMNILLQTERDQATEPEETSARRLLPALCSFLKKRFPEREEPLHLAA